MIEVTDYNKDTKFNDHAIWLPEDVRNIKISLTNGRAMIWINDIEVVINVPLVDGVIYITEKERND